MADFHYKKIWQDLLYTEVLAWSGLFWGYLEYSFGFVPLKKPAILMWRASSHGFGGVHPIPGVFNPAGRFLSFSSGTFSGRI